MESIMDRRTFLRQTVSFPVVVSTALAGVAEAAALGLAPGSSPQPGRPNVIMFLTDDNVFEYWGFSGGLDLSPNIDRIAQEGVTCTQFYCASSVCTPSRFNLHTARYAGRCREKSFLDNYPTSDAYCIRWNTFLDPEKDFTMGKAFQQGGYSTGFVGKWHLTPDKTGIRFDTDADPADPQVAAKLKKWYQAHVDVVKTTGYDYVGALSPNNNDFHPLKALHVHNLEWIAKGAIDFLDSCAENDKPFFLIVNITTHHGPCHRESIESDIRLTQAGLVEGLEGVFPPRQSIRSRIEQEGYEYDFRTAGTVWTDDCVGAILDRLNELGLKDNTACLFTSDHNARGSKGTCYELGVRVPFAMRLKDHIPANSTCDQRFQMIDIFPTLVEMCDIKLPSSAKLDGISAWKALAGEMKGKQVRDELFFEFGYVRAVRYKNWKYIGFRLPDDLLDKMKNRQVRRAYNYQGLFGNERPVLKHYNYFEPDQLYNLDNDPDELVNLARKPEYAENLSEMKKRLKRILATFDHPFEIDHVEDFYYSHRYRQLCERARADVSFEGQYWWEKECVW